MMSSLATAVNFGKSLVFGSPGQYVIGGTEIEFIDKYKPLYNPISKAVYQVFHHVFPCITLQYSYQFMHGISMVIANKVASTKGELRLEILSVGGVSPFFIDSDINKNLFTKVHSLAHFLFCSGMFFSSIAMSSTIIKPVALLVSASAFFATAKHVHQVYHLYSDFRFVQGDRFGWKGNTILVATYALSLFAAYKLI